ncbi:MAG TPA: hypothetical protein GXZ40_05575 [Bacteroidales bacterium]|jgi:potassium uptake TrkH family protein|nr:hypothetical protein [Bacteroidales bacterium]
MPRSYLRKFTQQFNLHIVKYHDRLVVILRSASLLISLITISAIVYFHGFYISADERNLIKFIVHFSIAFYILKYLLYYIYSIRKKEYIKDTFIEFIIISLLVLNWILISLFDINIPFLNYDNFDDFYLLFIQFYFLIMVMIEISKASKLIIIMRLSPPVLMILSFFLLITIGTILLLLPRMTTSPISFIDALFTSTSASCITGLTVLDLSTAFTFKGQVIIMILIQLGGLNILSFATFFSAYLARSSAGLRYQHLLKDLLSTNKLSDSFQLLKGIFIMTFTIEALGVALLYVYWKTTNVFMSDGDSFFYALFHSISAFNNAGFSLWSGNLMDNVIANHYFPQGILTVLVILGGIGFVTLNDFFNPNIIRERRKYRWKQLMPSTKIVLYTTFGIIGITSIILFILEYKNTLAIKTTLFEKILTCIFQVSSARTAGFNLVDATGFALPTLIIIMIVMFIGASPGSTGGGIKTTTFFVLMKSMFATIRGKKYIEFQKKTIPFELVDKAYSIILMALIVIVVSTFVLTIVEPQIAFEKLLFESISAFSTCGLSNGACELIGLGGKIVLVLNMYIGRIGTLTLAFALSKRVKEAKHQYPDTHFMVG